MMFLLAWNAGNVNSILHFLLVLKLPAFVDHLVLLSLDFFQCLTNFLLIRVAPQPESNKTLSLWFSPHLSGHLLLMYPSDIVDNSSVLTRFFGRTKSAVVTRHSALHITSIVLECWTLLSLHSLVSRVVSHCSLFLFCCCVICLQSCPTGPHQMSSQQVDSSSTCTQSSGSFLILISKFSNPRDPTWSGTPNSMLLTETALSEESEASSAALPCFRVAALLFLLGPSRLVVCASRGNFPR